MAKATAVDALTRLTGYCFADHIDAHLAAKGLSTLSTLQQDASFVAAYQAMFLDPDTVDAQIERDLLVHNIAYSSSMLFVSNYFQHEATPALHEPSQIWLKTFGQIAQAKIVAAAQEKATDQAVNLAILVLSLCKALPVAYAQQDPANSNFLRPPKAGEILQPLAGMDVPDNVKQEIERLKQEDLQLGDWKTYGELLAKLWDTVASTYSDAVRSVSMVQTAHYEETVMMGPDAVPPTIITTTTGQATVDWINRGEPSVRLACDAMDGVLTGIT